jgi:hypothetical protein
MVRQLNYANIANNDQSEEVEKTSPENTDQQGFLGSETDPELATEHDTLEIAQEMGLYSDADDEHPAPLGESSNTISD